MIKLNLSPERFKWMKNNFAEDDKHPVTFDHENDSHEIPSWYDELTMEELNFLTSHTPGQLIEMFEK